MVGADDIDTDGVDDEGREEVLDEDACDDEAKPAFEHFSEPSHVLSLN